MLHIYFYSALRQRLLLSLSFSHFSIISPSQSLSLSHFSTFSLSIFLFLTWEHYLFASLLSLTLYIYFSHLITFSPTTLSLSLLSPTHITQSHLSHSFKIRPNVEKRWTDVNAQKISLSSCSHFFLLSFTFWFGFFIVCLSLNHSSSIFCLLFHTYIIILLFTRLTINLDTL